MISDLRLCDLCAAANDAWAAGTRGTYDAGDCHVYRTDEDGYTVLAAAGSEHLQDWITDLVAGWRTDAAAVMPLILDVVADMAPLIITGHSKGGVDAIDLADRLRHRLVGINIVRLVTFEAPKAGAHPGLRPDLPGPDYAHHGDVVPLLPIGEARPQPLTWFTDPALVDFAEPFANHHLATAVRPALVRYLATHPEG